MPGQALELWSFIVVAPDHPDGWVEFQYALVPEISNALRRQERDIWGLLMDQVDDTARRKVEDTLP